MLLHLQTYTIWKLLFLIHKNLTHTSFVHHKLWIGMLQIKYSLYIMKIHLMVKTIIEHKEKFSDSWIPQQEQKKDILVHKNWKQIQRKSTEDAYTVQANE